MKNIKFTQSPIGTLHVFYLQRLRHLATFLSFPLFTAHACVHITLHSLPTFNFSSVSNKNPQFRARSYKEVFFLKKQT